MKKALVNNFSNNKAFIKGNLYTDKEVAHLDQADFEDVVDDKKKKVVEDIIKDEVQVEAEVVEAPKKKSKKTK